MVREGSWKYCWQYSLLSYIAWNQYKKLLFFSAKNEKGDSMLDLDKDSVEKKKKIADLVIQLKKDEKISNHNLELTGISLEELKKVLGKEELGLISSDLFSEMGPDSNPTYTLCSFSSDPYKIHQKRIEYVRGLENP
ncbi:MAG: hypothetical protein ACD_3C00110G0001 [uncultured bacterium (gcode 4)]|uniref:Uncharacterized protein n=1 Tax=uncultured bacterium (gcode 4) TaxID=1234023 RepID=K2FYJ8_9BACT|nr:MAG: hypothetical protein ACD_3C00110G0001 [uncultured bacterium (gcode 4)]